MSAQDQIARAFTDARAAARALATYPGKVPGTLAEAYAIQDRQLDWLSSNQGWKIAAIRPEFRDGLGESRLAGPILRRIAVTNGQEVEVPVIVGGFAAVEAEVIFKLGSDVPAAAPPEEIAACIASVHIGVEVAGSPLSSLSSLGPVAVISDHGNNAAVVRGPEVPEGFAFEDLAAQVSINGMIVGQGGSGRLPAGGPFGSLFWLVDHLHQRGHVLRAGDWVATGAMTGVHPVKPGDLALIQIGTQGVAVKLTSATTKVAP